MLSLPQNFPLKLTPSPIYHFPLLKKFIFTRKWYFKLELVLLSNCSHNAIRPCVNSFAVSLVQHKECCNYTVYTLVLSKILDLLPEQSACDIKLPEAATVQHLENESQLNGKGGNEVFLCCLDYSTNPLFWCFQGSQAHPRGGRSKAF